MDGQADGQTDNGDFIGSSIGWGSNKEMFDFSNYSTKLK